MRTRTQVGKWGRSVAVRIPAVHVKELHLEEGDVLEMTRVGGGLLLLPKKKRAYNLGELLDQIKPENIHGETDWGQPSGHETW